MLGNSLPQPRQHLIISIAGNAIVGVPQPFTHYPHSPSEKDSVTHLSELAYPLLHFVIFCLLIILVTTFNSFLFGYVKPLAHVTFEIQRSNG